MEDPFYVVKDEVFRALNKTRGLYVRWAETSAGAGNGPNNSAGDAELRNALRSIDWDLEDLEDTIGIVEKNSTKFKIDIKEISERRSFIEATKQEVQAMRGKVAARGRRVGTAGYARLASADGDSPARHTDERLNETHSISKQNLDDHTLSPCDLTPPPAVLPCEDHTQYAPCPIPHRTGRAPRMLRDRRQWLAIGILALILVTLILLFIIL